MMPFEFILEAESVSEIYRDPIGHYHHWTIFAGHLQSGIIRKGDKIQVPGPAGVNTAGYVLSFFKTYSRPSLDGLGDEINAETHRDLIGLMIWRLAPMKSRIAPGAFTDCSDEHYQQTLLRILEHDPARIIHGRGKEYPEKPCGECERTLPNVDEAIPLLQKLVKGEDRYIAQRAEAILKSRLFSVD